MLIKSINSMFPVGTYEIFQYRNNKFALYFSHELLAVRSSLQEVVSILNKKTK